MRSACAAASAHCCPTGFPHDTWPSFLITLSSLQAAPHAYPWHPSVPNLISPLPAPPLRIPCRTMPGMSYGWTQGIVASKPPAEDSDYTSFANN
jgi:hypothetical protein